MMMTMKQHPLQTAPATALPFCSPRNLSSSSQHVFKAKQRSRVPSSSQLKEGTPMTTEPVVRSEHKLGALDNILLTLFRNKMVEEVGWDSELPGYDGLIQVANRLLINAPTNAQAAQAAVRILRSLFPPFLPPLFKILVAPLANGHLAAIMVARVTALSCQWLMGPCKVNSVELPNGYSWETGVLVERCKYLEASKCVGICINTCKLPTQTFIMDYMGVPLMMEPNFSDYSCQFKFGVAPPMPAEDKSLSEPCLEICPNSMRRRELRTSAGEMRCPKV